MKKIGILSVVLIISVFILINIWWLRVDNKMPIPDTAWHFGISIAVWNLFFNFSMEGLRFFAACAWHPPFVGIIVRPFYFLLGHNLDSAVIIMNLIFLPILVFSVYGIIKFCTGRAIDGVLGCVVLLSYPEIIILSRYYLLDLPLAAMVSLSIYSLMRSELFNFKKYSILFGVAAGFSILTKEIFILFILGPLLYAFSRINNKKQIKNFIFSMLLFIFIAGLWYFPVAKTFTLNAIRETDRGILNSYGLFCNTAPLTKYFTIIGNQTGYINYIFFCIGLIFFLLKRNKNIGILIAWLIVSYLFILSWRMLEDYKFQVSILPAMAIITIVGFSCLTKKLKFFVYPLLFIASILQFSASTCNLSWLPYKISLQKPKVIISLFNRSPIVSQYAALPFKKERDWHINEFIEFISEQELLKNEVIFIIPIWHYAYSQAVLNYYACQQKILVSFVPMGSGPSDSVAKDKKFRYFLDVDNCQTNSRMRDYIKGNSDKFDLVFKHELFNGDRVMLYKKKGP